MAKKWNGTIDGKPPGDRDWKWYLKGLEHGADSVREFKVDKPKRTGKCKEHAKPNGCQLPNVHCGYPECDEYKN